MKICENCGEKIADSRAECPYCLKNVGGVKKRDRDFEKDDKISDPAESFWDKNKTQIGWTYFVIAIIFGLSFNFYLWLKGDLPVASKDPVDPNPYWKGKQRIYPDKDAATLEALREMAKWNQEQIDRYRDFYGSQQQQGENWKNSWDRYEEEGFRREVIDMLERLERENRWNN